MDSDSIYKALEWAYFSDNPEEADVVCRLPMMLAGVRHFLDIGASLGTQTVCRPAERRFFRN